MGKAHTGVAVFHGFTSTPASMRPLAQALEGAGHRVDLPLLPGHGTSWEDLERTPHQQILRAALASYDRLAARCAQVAVAGLSMGGALALHVAAHRRVTGVVTINPALRLKPFTGAGAAGLGRLRRTVPPVAGNIARPGVEEEAYPATPLRAVAGLDRLLRQVRGELDRVEAPVLLMRSARDDVLPPSSADTLERRLRPGRLTTVRLENSLHVATLDYDADKITRHTLEFLHEQETR